ncbi:hypothetical protein, partial [Vineibacter terrae]|uniref:hypothetical protein n=1 Tax=Vineibacter terrae TaxID=2586908 RepID=UPI002E355EBE
MKTATSFDPAILGIRPRPGAPGHVLQLVPLGPVLISRAPPLEAVPAPTRRTKIWELSKHLHCSIVGTCLSAAELRQILVRAGVACDGKTDHELHGQGVLLAGQRDGAGKLLHKALDRRHRLAISQLEKARTEDEVRGLWRDAVKRGDIPGAYWAALTHPATTEALVREIFGEVHMLSHLVGAANRADIRRLSALEAQNAELQAKLRRQQEQLREGITARDAKLRELSALLARRIADGARSDAVADGSAGDDPALERVVRDLERRLTSEAGRRDAVEKRLQRMADTLRCEQEQRAAAERREAALRDELKAVDARLASSVAAADEATDVPAGLDGLSLLYIGGRPSQLSHLRAVGERFGARVLHHDGGVEDRSGLLAGLVSRAD